MVPAARPVTIVMSHTTTLLSAGPTRLLHRPFSNAHSRCRAHWRLRPRASKDGDNLVNEDLIAKLKAAEEEAQRLKKELAAAKSQVGLFVRSLLEALIFGSRRAKHLRRLRFISGA